MKKPIPFGKYVLLDRINVGGMAEVFKAKAFGVEGFERLVAVKRILPSIAEDQEFITMFIDEAKIAVQLNHANIAQIFDLGKVTDSYFIAMEYVHGKDLRAIFDRARKRGETVPIPMACYVAMKVCEGLDYAHNKKDAAARDLNLVHRDVSPQNILISFDGETKIIDFGIAKAAGKAGKTQAGILKGKFGYMSPEQVRGLPLDRRSDIFAVGIVLYELLTGERLFIGESDFSTLEKVRNVEIMPPSTYNRRVPDELEQIVLKTLAKDVDDRYQTAMDLHDDLQSFMYTSGNFFARKDLSGYMRKAFAEEIERETAQNEEYQDLDLSTDSSDLDAFADIEPASPKAANISSPAGKRSGKPTILGVGGAAIPPPPPPRSSVPPPPPPSAKANAAASVPSASPVPAMSADVEESPTEIGKAPMLEMDWDEDELSTQIYDKPEDIAAALGALPRVPADPYNLANASASTSSAGLGEPSPFDPMEAELIHSDEMAAPEPVKKSASGHAEPTEVVRNERRESRTSLMTYLSLGAAAIVLLGIGSWFMFFRTEPGTLHLSTSPADAVLYLDETPLRSGDPTETTGAFLSSTASPFVVENIPPGAHILEVRRRGFQSWATRIQVESGGLVTLPNVDLVAAPDGATAVAVGSPAPTGATTPGTDPPGTGFSLDTVPSGARVTIDGTAIANTTPVRLTNLSPGAHTVRVELDNHSAWATQINVTEGQVLALPNAVLTRQQMNVRFVSEPPGAAVTLIRGDERRAIGQAPISSTLDLSNGSWTAEMQLDGYQTWSQVLQLNRSDNEQTVRATLEAESRPRTRTTTRRPSRRTAPAARTSPARPSRTASRPARSTPSTPAATPARPTAASGPGRLSVQSIPWSQVYVDGRRVGNAPVRNIELSAGRHTVTFIREDLNIRVRRSVTVTSGQDERLVVRLLE